MDAVLLTLIVASLDMSRLGVKLSTPSLEKAKVRTSMCSVTAVFGAIPCTVDTNNGGGSLA